MCVHSPITASICSVIKEVSVQAIINVVMLLGFLAHGYVRVFPQDKKSLRVDTEIGNW